jgi:23S rRNA pseudouridine2605 synthase
MMLAESMKNKEKEYMKKQSKQERLQKVIASTGIASRRSAEKLILEGKVQVNNKTVKELGTKVDPRKDKIKVDNNPLVVKDKTYKVFVLNKPKECITSKKDEEGRKTVYSFLSKRLQKYKPVGRLDYNTEGILLFTEDGELLYRLTHPKYNVRRKYLVRARGIIPEKTFKKFAKEGVRVENYTVRNLGFLDIRYTKSHTWFEIELGEGRYREVKKIVEAMNSTVVRLKRTAYGTIYKNIPPVGKVRQLNDEEVDSLYDLVKLKKENNL